MTTAILILAGLVAQMMAWRVVTRGERPVLGLVPFVLASMGVVAIVAYPDATPSMSTAASVVVGAVSGVFLWGATRVFVVVASRWRVFRTAVASAYGRASDVPLARELVLSLALAVPGEELFWRGFTQQSLAVSAAGPAVAALVAWALYVVGNLPSRSLPIVMAAVVGGAVWGALAWWSGGVVAPLASHILWTGLMLAVPPSAAGENA
jgi:hypothetical protein